MLLENVKQGFTYALIFSCFRETLRNFIAFHLEIIHSIIRVAGCLTRKTSTKGTW